MAGPAVQAEIIPSLLDCGDESLELFSCVYARQRIQVEGCSWATSIPRSDWNPAQLAIWGLQMPFSTETWDWLASKSSEVEGIYWGKAGTWGGADVDLYAAERVTRQLRGAGRPWAALEFLMGRQQMKHDVIAGMVYEVLEAIAANPGKTERDTMDGHNIHEAFRFLHDANDPDETRL